MLLIETEKWGWCGILHRVIVLEFGPVESPTGCRTRYAGSARYRRHIPSGRAITALGGWAAEGGIGLSPSLTE